MDELQSFFKSEPYDSVIIYIELKICIIDLKYTSLRDGRRGFSYL